VRPLDQRTRPRTLAPDQVRFVVMGNVFPTGVRLHRKYDLKGSTHKRTVGPSKVSNPRAVLKDLDLDVQLRLSADVHAELMAQVRASLFLSCKAAMGKVWLDTPAACSRG
jgi:Phosphatidylinositol-4-phosphate 5-Kinase